MSVAELDDAWNDPSVDALDASARAGLGAYWMMRAASELRVSHVFRALGHELQSTGASDVVHQLVASAIDDEARHSEICRRLAERYAGHAFPPPCVKPPSLPAFEGADPALRAALHVTTLSCVNETIASSWLRECLERSTSPLARAANRLHLREEIQHARLGWAHLASEHVTPPIRKAIPAWLPRILRANVPQWFRPDASLPEGGIPEHGALGVADTRALVLEAVRDVVLPGLEEVGIDPSSGRAWLEQQDG